jgi:hypothetical protein
MGRWRRKNRFKAKPKGDSATGFNTSWSWKERGDLIRYLKTYRQHAERVSDGTYDAESLSMKKSFVRTIGVVEMPVLDQRNVSAPYLALPRTLSSKQRLAVHESCVEGKTFCAAKIHLFRIAYSNLFSQSIDISQSVSRQRRRESRRPILGYLHIRRRL